MNIHEYQAKALLRSYGAPVSDGRVVLKAEDAKAAAGEMDGPLWVIKAQIHAGGRGKGGGVKLARGPAKMAGEGASTKTLGANCVWDCGALGQSAPRP